MSIFNIKTEDDGTIKYYKDGYLYALEYVNGTKKWYQNGLLHRDDDFPAIEWSNGDKEWYQNDELHRDDDLPAIEYKDGNKEWWKNGQRHRDGDLPAVEFRGNKEWCKNGLLHRDGDLPAVEYTDGTKYWYKYGKRVSLEYCKSLFAIDKFRSKIKKICSMFKLTPKEFYRMIKFIKTREFVEWWYNPNNHGGMRDKQNIINSLSKIRK